jgi:hypothetical protein
MKLMIVPVTPFQQNCSILVDETTGQAVAIDPYSGEAARNLASAYLQLKRPADAFSLPHAPILLGHGMGMNMPVVIAMTSLSRSNILKARQSYRKLSTTIPSHKLGHHLDPTIKRTPWSEDEDRCIITLQHRLGNKWAEIAGEIEGRCVLERRGRGSGCRRRWRRCPPPRHCGRARARTCSAAVVRA